MRHFLCLTVMFFLTSGIDLTHAEILGDCQQPSGEYLRIESCPTVAQNSQTQEADLSRIYHNRGTNLLHRGEWQKAISVFGQTLRHDPKHPYTYYNRGYAHCRKNQNALGISDLGQALRLEPNFAEAYHFRGLLHFERREFESALSDLNLALRLAPKNGHAELYRDRSSLCIQKGLYCDKMEGDRCDWTLHIGLRKPFIVLKGLVRFFGR